MTLCVAWRRGGENNVSLASDSRISVPGASSDFGIKLLPVPIRIYGPRDSSTGITSLIHESTYGLGFAGSFLAAQTIREFLFIVLQRLQAIPDQTDTSFEGICSLVLKYANHLAKQLSSELKLDHFIDFFFCGCCPNNKEVKLAKFFTDSNSSYLKTIYADKSYTHAIGAGKQIFAQKLSSQVEPHWSAILNVLDQLSSEEPSVGGNIQFGDFDASLNFRTMGIIRDSIDEHGQLSAKYCLAGIDMNGDEFKTRGSDLFIIGNYIDPFKGRHS